MLRFEIMLNRTTLILMLFFSLNAITQSLNPSFLESLPDNIKADFLNQMNENGPSDTEYVSPDTRLKKLESSLKDAEDTLNKIKSEIDLEHHDDSTLLRFGSIFFSTFQSTFLPTNQTNIGTDYILDAGDKLSIQIIGQRNYIVNPVLNLDGTINIPELGVIGLAGLNLQEARALIEKKASDIFAGSKVFISISELRDINVLIVGNAEKPGMYTVAGGSSPLSVILAAGGITQAGTYREILHKRNNQLLQTIDLYDVLINGNFNFKNSLRSGDVILVQPKLKEVRVSGSFANPAIYEIRDSEDLSILLKMSGARINNSKDKILINRFNNNGFENIELDSTDAKNFSLLPGDSVQINAIEPKFNKAKKVTLTGEFRVPGEYIISDNTRLSELIDMAGQYTDNAYPLGGVFTRSSVRDVESQYKEKAYSQIVNYLLNSNQNSGLGVTGMSENIITLLSVIKEYKPIGRVISSFNLSDLKSNPSKDRILQDGDHIHVPTFAPEIFVFGEVMNPGAISYQSLLTINDYIIRSGGFSRLADKNRIIVIQPDGDVKNITSSRFFGDLFSDNLTLLPGATIFVPSEIGKVDGVNLAATLSPIISSFALSVASLNSINN